MKPLDLNEKASISIRKYPELIGIIADMGFPQVRNPIMRNVFAKKYTLNQAIDMSGLDRAYVIDMLTKKGFSVRE